MATIAVYTNFGGHIIKENRGGTKRGYVPDPLGSTIALVDSTGAVTDTWEYAAYGEVESHTGSATTPFTFVGTLGYFRDLVSKLTYVRARFYQGAIGQWMTLDPLWPHMRSYEYTFSRPISFVDPSGAQAMLTPFDVPGLRDVIIGVWEETLEQTWGRSPICCALKIGPLKNNPGIVADKTGGPDGNEFNAIAHCTTACRIALQFPECVWYWKYREMLPYPSLGDSKMDIWNNAWGFLLADAVTLSCDCQCLCSRFRALLSWHTPPPGHNYPPGGFGGSPVSGPPIYPMGNEMIRGGTSPIFA